MRRGRRQQEPKAREVDPVVRGRIVTQHRAKFYLKKHSPDGYPMKLVPRGNLRIEDRPALLPGRASVRPRTNVWVRA